MRSPRFAPAFARTPRSVVPGLNEDHLVGTAFVHDGVVGRNLEQGRGLFAADEVHPPHDLVAGARVGALLQKTQRHVRRHPGIHADNERPVIPLGPCRDRRGESPALGVHSIDRLRAQPLRGGDALNGNVRRYW
jgi:hypothetical protein